MFNSGQFKTPIVEKTPDVEDIEPEIESEPVATPPLRGRKRRSHTPAPEKRRVYNQYDYQPQTQQQHQPAPQYIRRDPEEIRALEDTITAHRAYAVKLKFKNKLYKRQIIEMQNQSESRNVQYQNEIQIARISAGIPQGLHF